MSVFSISNYGDLCLLSVTQKKKFQSCYVCPLSQTTANWSLPRRIPTRYFALSQPNRAVSPFCSLSTNPTMNILCTEDVIESGYDNTVVNQLFGILLRDDNEELISLILRNDGIFRGKGQQLLAEASSFSALGCVMALVKGETPLPVHVNLPDSYGHYPLHDAAETLDPCVVELLLYLGARADSRTVEKQLLPLHLALEKFLYHRRLRELTPEHSIFKLITVLCLPKLQNQLESIGLLAWTTEETEEEFLQYAKYGKLKELAALLMVAQKKLTGPMQTVRNTISSHALIDDKKKQNLLLLLEVFDRAGDAIEAYVKQEKIGVTMDQSVKKVTILLQEAGFPLNHDDTDLNCFQWYCEMGLINLTECRWKPQDIHLPHYGKSGYRWMAYSSDACRVVGNETFYYDEDFELAMDELSDIMGNDDKEEFILAMLRNESLLRGKEQNLLVEASCCGALECIVALVKGETHATVDINLPDSDGFFPIYHAAQFSDPCVIELFLYLGARADTRSVRGQLLPLHRALEQFISKIRLREWQQRDPNHSIFKLITLLCLPDLQDRLEGIGLLACPVEETEEEFLRYVRYGQLKELAALLMVAHKKLSGPRQIVRNTISSGRSLALIKGEEKQKLLLLLEVFERAGDAIEAYAKQEKIGVTVDQSVNKVTCLLQEAGFPVKHEDTALNCFEWFHKMERMDKTYCKCQFRPKKMIECTCNWKPWDMHMPHYGKSGYRWKAFKMSE